MGSALKILVAGGKVKKICAANLKCTGRGNKNCGPSSSFFNHPSPSPSLLILFLPPPSLSGRPPPDEPLITFFTRVLVCSSDSPPLNEHRPSSKRNFPLSPNTTESTPPSISVSSTTSFLPYTPKNKIPNRHHAYREPAVDQGPGRAFPEAHRVQGVR